MYIKYNYNDYPCKCVISKDTISYKNLPDNFPASVKGEITLYSDDGQVMRTDNTANYNKQSYADGVLTLTNRPDPTPIELIEPTPTEIEQLRADVDYIAVMTGVEL